MDYPELGRTIITGIIIFQAIIIFVLYTQKSRTAPSGYHLDNPEEDYRDLFENANDAIFILDEKQNYIDVNQKAVELFGYSREEFLQLNVRDVIPADQIKHSDKKFAELIHSGKYERFIGKQRTKNGRWLDIEVNSSVIKRNGKVIGSRDIIRDITDRKKQEEERLALIADLKSTLDEIAALRGLLQICVNCKKIKGEKGQWSKIELTSQHSETEFTHGCCPDCLQELYPDLPEEIFVETDSQTG